MLALLRQFGIGLVVLLMVTTQAFAARDTQHRIEHAAQYPGVPYADAAQLPHDHEPSAVDDHHDHDSDHGSAVATDLLDQPDTDSPPALPHHHHAGVDLQVAVIDPDRAMPLHAASTAPLLPGRATRLPGTRPDGPLDPPKQHA